MFAVAKFSNYFADIGKYLAAFFVRITIAHADKCLFMRYYCPDAPLIITSSSRALANKLHYKTMCIKASKPSIKRRSLSFTIHPHDKHVKSAHAENCIVAGNRMNAFVATEFLNIAVYTFGAIIMAIRQQEHESSKWRSLACILISGV